MKARPRILMAGAASALCASLACRAHSAEIRFTPADDPASFAARVRDLRKSSPRGDVTVRLAEGVYRLSAPLVLTPDDSAHDGSVTRWVGEGGGAVFSGGVAVEGWRAEPDGTWSAPLPKGGDGRPLYFEQLFVDGRRAARARFPDSGFVSMEAVDSEFYDAAGGRAEKREGAAKETVLLRLREEAAAKLSGLAPEDAPYAQLLCNFKWERLRRPLAPGGYDGASRTLRTSGRPLPPWAYLSKDDLYAFENLRSAFDAPGEWFYDAPAAKVRYRPLPGERPESSGFTAPVALETLLEIRGEPAEGRYVDDVAFANVAFSYTAPQGGAGRGPSDIGPSQAAVGVCGACIVADGARRVTFDGCRVVHTGSYAVWLREGCKECGVRRSVLSDLGAGGVRIGAMAFREWGRMPKGAVEIRNPYCPTSTESNRVEDCMIEKGGRFHPQGVGVIITHSSDNVVTHNEIRDLFYTGVSVGWVWGYAGSVAQRNEVSYNRIHGLGQGQLADMGGVYTLGTSFGTRVANNVIYDVDSYSYGGWGLYPDEGSEGEVWENNLVYDTKDASFHQHYGRDNVLRNNILCYSRQGQVAVTRAEDHRSLTAERNIICWTEGPTFQKYGGTLSEKARIDWRSNLWWKEKGEVEFNGKTFAEWQAKGNDAGGIVADPKFRDPARRDFRLAPDSPALRIGFVPFDPSEAGIRR